MSEPQKTSILAVLSLAFAFCCFPLALLFGVLALSSINKSNGQLGGKGLAIAGMVVSLAFAVPNLGILAAIAIPNFVKFQCRSKQSEAKVNLKALYIGQEMHRGEHNRYSSSLDDIQFTVTGANRYRYEIVTADDEHFTARAVATDPTLEGDEWEINESNALVNVTSACGPAGRYRQR